MWAAVFPGQGSQHLGMGLSLYEDLPYVRALFEEAEDVFSLKLRTIMWDGSEEQLQETHYAQPSLFVVSMAVLRGLEEECGLRPEKDLAWVAGHSLGEYSAFCAAKVFSFSQTLGLLKERCRAMSLALPGGMVALLGLAKQEVEVLVGDLDPALGVCEVANHNGLRQVVVSGATMALAAIAQKVPKAIFLRVKGPFHSSLMQEAQEAFAPVLETTLFQEPLCPIVTNFSGRGQRDPVVLKQHLGEQMVHPVLWCDTQQFLFAHGVTDLLEVGAGRVLCGLAKHTIPLVRRVSLGNRQEIQGWHNPSA